jgi:mono/diheme cytochrome c family protein
MVSLRRIALLTIGAGATAAITIGRAEPPTPQTPADLTFHKDIAPIFQKHCLSCHHAGGTASTQILDDYRLGRSWFTASKTQVIEKKMPPWPLDPAVGHWKNADTLSEADIKTIADWVDLRAPEGDAANAPPPMDFNTEWKMGAPDRTLTMAEPHKLEMFGAESYRAFVLEPAFESDTWVSGVELKPGEVSVVHQMSLSIAPTEAARAADAAEEGPGFAAFDRGWHEAAQDDLVVWTRGLTPIEPLPAGTGILIPAGSSLVLRIHYVPSEDEDKADRSSVGLHLAETPPARALKTLAVENRQFEIPAESYAHEIKAERTLEAPIRVQAVLPRMHYLGAKMSLTAHLPDGTARPLISLSGYNYDLMALYVCAEPIDLPAGTRLEATAAYENNYDNLNNPNLSIKKATYGPAPANEVMSVVLQYVDP